jgi:hypothetical protein
MLTKSDLHQIRTVVEEVVELKIEQKLEVKLTPIQKDLSSIRKDLKKVHRSLKKDIKDHFNFLDKYSSGIHKRVTRIEDHLDLPSSQAV